MQIIRYDLQGVCEERVYESEEDLRQQLVELHGGEIEEEKDLDILRNMPLNEICAMFGWQWERKADNER